MTKKKTLLIALATALTLGGVTASFAQEVPNNGYNSSNGSYNYNGSNGSYNYSGSSGSGYAGPSGE